MSQRSRWWTVVAVVACLVAPLWAADEPEADEPVTPEQLQAVADAVAPALVVVEYTLRYDQGEPPGGGSGYRGGYGYSSRYGNYGGAPGGFFGYGEGAGGPELIAQERPMEVAGYLVGPTQVVTGDYTMHPRFIESIAVRRGEQRVAAKIAAIAPHRAVVILELEQPLPGARPVAFGGQGERRFAVRYALSNALWTASVVPIGKAAKEQPSLIIDERGRRYAATNKSYGALVVDETGTAVGVPSKPRRGIDEAWEGSPLQWPLVPLDQLQAALASLEESAEQNLLRVKLHLRSPPSQGDPYGRYSGGWSDGQESEIGEEETERTVPGLLVDPETVLVLAMLHPKVTARLERIVVHIADDREIEATFAHSLEDYGAIVAKLAEPLPAPVTLRDGDVLDLEGNLLLRVEVRMQGDSRVTYFHHTRINYFMLGHGRQVLPWAGYGQGLSLVFDLEGRLAALPMTRRQKVSVREQWSRGQPSFVPAAQLAAILADPAGNADPNNVPLTEEEQNRLAWLGVELQPLNPELARINKVSHLTQDGRIGAIVSYIYPDSPAAKAEIELGDILIRLRAEGQPKPLEVQMHSYGGFSMGDFPWDQFESMPAEYFDQMPSPWGLSI